MMLGRKLEREEGIGMRMFGGKASQTGGSQCTGPGAHEQAWRSFEDHQGGLQNGGE